MRMGRCIGLQVVDCSWCRYCRRKLGWQVRFDYDYDDPSSRRQRMMIKTYQGRSTQTDADTVPSMSSATETKRRRLPPMQGDRHLPLELLLEVIARSDDAASIVRCAAASRPLRRAMLGGGFRPVTRVGLIAAVHAGYDPARLLGVSYASADRGDGDGEPDIVRASWRLRFDTSQLRSFELVSSRGGLLVLWRHEAEAEPELRVCNTFTGDVACLPYMDGEVGKWGNPGIYQPALLTVADAGRSFELLAMDWCLRTCIFSSKDGSGKWGAIRLVTLPPEHGSWCFVNQSSAHTSPAIIGRIVHWICRSTRRAAGVFILAVHADSAQATAIEPPPPLQGYLGGSSSSAGSCCTLAATPEGNLVMFVPEDEVISMWTLSSSTEVWSRNAVICKHGIGKQVMPGVDVNGMICWCVGFRERSRTVIFWMEKVGLIELNLGTMKANVLPWCSEHVTSRVAGVCFHEIDVASLL